jgi:hypothetical protein
MTPEIAVMPVGGGARREFRVTVANAAKGAGEAVVRLEVPAGWKVEPPSRRPASASRETRPRPASS